MSMEERRQLGDGWIGLRGGRAVEEEPIGSDLKGEGTTLGQPQGQFGQAAERGGDGGMRARVQRHGSRRRLARPRELREPRGIVCGHDVGGFWHPYRVGRILANSCGSVLQLVDSWIGELVN